MRNLLSDLWTRLPEKPRTVHICAECKHCIHSENDLLPPNLRFDCQNPALVTRSESDLDFFRVAGRLPDLRPRLCWVLRTGDTCSGYEEANDEGS